LSAASSVPTQSPYESDADFGQRRSEYDNNAVKNLGLLKGTSPNGTSDNSSKCYELEERARRKAEAFIKGLSRSNERHQIRQYLHHSLFLPANVWLTPYDK
jgi:hypothetical protein